ncbi:MAG TPA: hypothetical protein VI749_07495 [Candidatus Omnitrophota bacterium]|nr:hypothetical protein [Candidatus Omnitrophota bacterium]
MNCKDIRDIILTDFLDGEQWEEKRREIDQHLAGCLACRAFAEEAKEKAVTALQNAKPIRLDEEAIWQNIKNQIEEEAAPAFLSNPLMGFLTHLKDALLTPKVVMASVKVAIVLLVMVFQFKLIYDNHLAQQKPPAEEIQVLAYALEEFTFEESNGEESEMASYGTAIEEYFL